MMSLRKYLLFVVCYLASAVPLFANWEYSSADDGSRISIGIRGGIAMPSATMKNNLGDIVVGYYVDDNNAIFPDDPACTGGTGACTYIGSVNAGNLPVNGKYEETSFAGGASVGFTIPGTPNVRVEADWLHISESHLDMNPLFKGNVEMDIGTVSNSVAMAETTAKTDIISAMVYYDFFSGMQKKTGNIVPYVGAGIGYATSTTVLMLSDNYRDLTDVSFDSFGEQTAGGTIDFYTSQTEINNFALSGALGIGYGISDGIFLDAGLRLSYVPKIRWALNNGADEDAATAKERTILSAEDIVFTSIYAGVRFEF